PLVPADGCMVENSGSCPVHLHKPINGWKRVVHRQGPTIFALGVSSVLWQQTIQCRVPTTGWSVNFTYGSMEVGKEVIRANIQLTQRSVDVVQ
ncbi:Hypothetical predicted protein, partial [Pelobates cultripes]